MLGGFDSVDDALRLIEKIIESFDVYFLTFKEQRWMKLF